MVLIGRLFLVVIKSIFLSGFIRGSSLTQTNAAASYLARTTRMQHHHLSVLENLVNQKPLQQQYVESPTRGRISDAFRFNSHKAQSSHRGKRKMDVQFKKSRLQILKMSSPSQNLSGKKANRRLPPAVNGALHNNQKKTWHGIYAADSLLSPSMRISPAGQYPKFSKELDTQISDVNDTNYWNCSCTGTPSREFTNTDLKASESHENDVLFVEPSFCNHTSDTETKTALPSYVPDRPTSIDETFSICPGNRPHPPPTLPLPECCKHKFESCDNICDCSDIISPIKQHKKYQDHLLGPLVYPLFLSMAICSPEGQARDDEKYLCADIQPCILDVSHQIHSCIDGYILNLPMLEHEIDWPWNDANRITVCMDFPDKIWQLKSHMEIAVKISAMLPIILVGIVANILVLYLMVLHKHLHTPINVFIGNLAIADLLLAAICPVLFLLEDLNQGYVLGHTGCKIQGFVQTLLMMVSVFSITAVCAERLVTVMTDRLTGVDTPQRRRRNIQRATGCCVAIWVTAALVSFPLTVKRFYVDRQWIDYEETFCAEEVWVTKYYWPFLVVILIWLPMLFLTVAYAMIFYKLKQYEARTRLRSRPKTKKNRRRLLAIMFTILFVFIVCYTPYTVFLLVRVLVVGNFEGVNILFDVLWWFSHWLAFLNSAINPIIYSYTHDGFRKALKNSHSGFAIVGRCFHSTSSSRSQEEKESSQCPEHKYQWGAISLRMLQLPGAQEVLLSRGPRSTWIK